MNAMLVSKIKGVLAVVLIIGLGVGISTFAAAPPEQSVERLIAKLGSNSFAERENASRQLEAIGEPALAALYEAMKSDDPEVRTRAGRIVLAIENKLYPELRLVGHTAPVLSVCVSADGKSVLTSSADRTLRLWDAYTGKPLRVFEGHTAEVYGAALSPDGKRVLSGSSDKTVRLWDATTGKELQKMTGHTREALCVAFAPKGKALSTGYEREMYLWDLDTGKKARVLTGRTNYGYGVTYSDQARLAATCNSTVSLWD